MTELIFNLKTSEASQLCKITPLTLLRNIKAGHLIEGIHFIKTSGRHRLYCREILVNWLNCGRRTSHPNHIEAMEEMARQRRPKRGRKAKI